MKRTDAAVMLGLALNAGLAQAQTKTGTAIAQFVGIEPSARIAAMGNAGVAVDDGIQSLYYNPGALGAASKTAVQFSHGFWFADIAYDYAAVVLPAGNWGNFSAAVTALNSGEIDVRTVSQPLGTGQRYSVQDLAIGLGYGRQITDRFSAGGQINYVSESIWHSSMHVFTASIGTSYRINNHGLTLGSSLLQFGTKGKFEGSDLAIQFDPDPSQAGNNSSLPANQFTGEFPVPILFRVGLSYPQRLSKSSRLLVAVDAFHPSDNTGGMNIGWEWTWKEAFSVRGGYQNLSQQDSEVGLTGGVGVQGGLGAQQYHVDYAWTYHAFLQGTHRVTFVLVL